MEQDHKNGIVVAEDDPVTSLLLVSILKKWGYEPQNVRDGCSALRVLRNSKTPKVVLLDWLMPGMDGIDVVKNIRKNHAELNHYIIMLTSRSNKEDVISALDTGADDFVPKPFDPGELKARIDVGHRLISLNQELIRATQNANRLADFIAHYDQTTGLPNRVSFTEKVEQFIANKGVGTLMLVNIDRFKLINQAKGLDLGDLLLNYFGARLKALFDDNTIVARITADEFGVFIPMEQETDVFSDGVSDFLISQTSLIHTAMHEPFPIDNGISLTVSIGACPVTPDIPGQAEEFMRRADTALGRAKASGGNRTIIHDAQMEREIKERYSIEKDLSSAIGRKELRMFLQAQVDENVLFTGAEALVRWEHPSRGLLSPVIFIPIAEESDLIVKLGNWMLEEVCNLLKKHEGKNFSLSVNISPKQFYRPEFVSEVLNCINRHDITGHRLILEVTEGLLVKDVSEVAVKMQQLSETGIRFSIDDFGTGYSSLSYLTKLPISEIKIDRAFIKDLPGDTQSAAIVDAIVAMAQTLGLKLVAEGVETEDQMHFLSQKGRMFYQGFLFSRPAPAAEILSSWL